MFFRKCRIISSRLLSGCDRTGSIRAIVMKQKQILLCLLCLFVAEFTLLGQKPQVAEDVFKNIQVLKGVPVDEFMSTMGIFSAALGMSCEDCHASNDSKWENYALDTSPRKQTARRMA